MRKSLVKTCKFIFLRIVTAERLIPLDITRLNTYHNEDKEIKRVYQSLLHKLFCETENNIEGVTVADLRFSEDMYCNLPAGLRPPVFAGVARPPRPKAASPAKGLLPNLPICNNDEEIHRSEMGGGEGVRGRRTITRGVLKRSWGLRRHREVYLCMLEHVRHLARHARESPIASKNS